MRHICAVIISLCAFSLAEAGDANIRPFHARVALTNASNVGVVRLMNDAAIVRYFLEVYINAWDLDGMDDPLGGSLCLRISEACGRYVPGTLMCRQDASRTDRPEECPGILTSDMLDKALANARKGVPVVFTGSGMRITITLRDLRFSGDPILPGDEKRVELLEFDLDIVPDKSANKPKHFTRTPSLQ